MRHSTTIFGTFLAALVLATPDAAAMIDLAPLVHATIDSDAEAEYVAVSAFGDARCSTSSCIAVSGTGDAGQRSPGGYCRGGVSASVEGDACSAWAALSGYGTASAGSAPLSIFGKCATHESTYAPRECFDMLGSGDGQGYWLSVSDSGSSESRWVAISGDGDSNGVAAISGNGNSNGGEVAVSGTGAAACRSQDWGCLISFSMLGDSTCVARYVGEATPPSCIAMTVTGDANCAGSGWWTMPTSYCIAFAPLGNAHAFDDGKPVSLVGYCNGVRCFAVDPLGPAESYWVGASGTGDASGIVAFSVFGEADGTVALSLKDVLCDPDTVCVEP